MDEWEFMEAKLLRASRSGRVCITCQHFTYGTDAHCRTLLGCKPVSYTHLTLPTICSV